MDRDHGQRRKDLQSRCIARKQGARAVSSVVERLVYTEDVGSSTLSPPTIVSPTSGPRLRSRLNRPPRRSALRVRQTAREFDPLTAHHRFPDIRTATAVSAEQAAPPERFAREANSSGVRPSHRPPFSAHAPQGALRVMSETCFQHDGAAANRRVAVLPDLPPYRKFLSQHQDREAIPAEPPKGPSGP
jgi:hypothetical protein